jgi:tight adherence protein C
MTGAALGLLAGLGLLLALSRVPRRPTLASRVEPWLRETTPSPVAAPGLVRPALARLAVRVDEVLGGSAAVRRRLVLAGGTTTLEDFRMQQVLSGAGGLAVGAGLLALRSATGIGPAPLPGLALTLGLTVGGVLGREWHLGRQVRQRAERISAELPVVAELLALAVAAGEGFGGALERVARLAHGDLGDELRRSLADTRAGAGLVEALAGVGARTGVEAVARFTDGASTALERGTPLAEVLRAQAADAREAQRRALLEAGGRKEVAMLAPVVFLIMPTVVLFAVYPALTGLSLVVR